MVGILNQFHDEAIAEIRQTERTMVDHPLFKAIVNKRICDVKKISNNTFRDFMADYESLTQDLLKRLDVSHGRHP